ncbi:MAG: membrane dipeptidase [Alphaproteobacteria bacterium]|nr:membrane dipeptidase [Alphaproteobacteria bacterium]MDE2493066.1 membrane dipeptidase [Alphaproteobacteria bacterium]
MRTSLVWDNHGCLPLLPKDNYLPQLERYRRAGFRVVSINVGYAEKTLQDDLATINHMRDWISKNPQTYRLIERVPDIISCFNDGKLGITFDVEGMYPVQQDPALVEVLYSLGVRWMLVAYNYSNAAGGGCLDDDGGLTPCGRRLIDAMERAGMVLCVSHTGSRTASEAIDYSRNPVILSHSNPAAMHTHPRNVSDALMKQCAATGGVVGITGINLFLGTSVNLVRRFVDHVRYAIDVVGPKHVGMGLDYVFDTAELEAAIRENPQHFPTDLGLTELKMIPPEALTEIADQLSQSGLDDESVRGVLGKNWLRVAQTVWHS